MRRSLFAVLALACLLAPSDVRAQECSALYASAKTALDAFEPRSADSLATGAVRSAFQRARRCFERAPALDSVAANEYARTFGREVQVLWETRHPDEATALTETFLDGPHLRADSAGVRYLLEWRAYILMQRRDFEAASHTYAQLLDYAPSASPAVRARLWMNLGGVYTLLGWEEEALAIYRSVQDELGDVGDLSPDLLAMLSRAHANEAEALLRRRDEPGMLDASLAAARRSADLVAEADDPRGMHYRVFGLLHLAEALRFADQPDSSLATARFAERLAEELPRPAPTAVPLALEAAGNALLHLGRPEEAEAAFLRILVLNEQTGSRVSMQNAMRGLVKAALRSGDLARADSLAQQTIDLTEANRALLSELSEATSAGDWYPSYLLRVEVLLRQERVEEAFLTLDRARARVFRELRDRRSAVLDSADRVMADSLQRQIGGMYDRLVKIGMNTTEAHQLRNEVTRVLAERRSLFGTRSTDDMSIERLQQGLAERGQTLVTYSLYNPAHAFVLRPDTLLAVPLSDEDAHPDRIRELLRSVSTQWNVADGPLSLSEASFEMAPLHSLYQTLFAPIADLIPEGEPVVVVPEGPLARLPFGLLLEREADRFRFEEAPFLFRRHPLSTELAAALLLDSTSPEPPPYAAVFGRSQFGPVDGTSVSSPLSFVDLPSVTRELDMLARRLPDAFVALNEPATESAFYAHAPRAGLVHIASHAFVSESTPLRSFIQLSPDSTEDGRLYLSELLDMDLQAGLVVLSGCRTARGRDLQGEGTQGLHYAVRAAGAESSLGMMWRVDDEATVELMETFYEHLAEGERKDVALQRAQLSFLEQNRGLRASPFFWAAPVLYGNPEPLPLDASSGRSWMWGLALTAFLLVFLAPRLWRTRAARHD